MGTKAKANWSFSSSDGNHIINASVVVTFTHIILKAHVDGMPVIEKKSLSGMGVWGDYPFRAGQHVGLLQVSRKGLQGFKLELALDGFPVMPGQHANLAKPAPASAPERLAPPSQPAPTHTSTSVPVVPVLPPHCASCGSPISMQDVRWTGPMSAACGSCGSAVPVEWKKVG